MRFELGTVTSDQVTNYYQTSTRITRAETILENVKLDAPDIYIVKSASDKKTKYVTDTRAGTCTCPDWTYRGSITGIACKHILSARMKERMERLNQ